LQTGLIPRLEVLFDDVPGDAVPEYGGNPRWTGLAANFVESVRARSFTGAWATRVRACTW
jgi:hypothetical protein